jgi:hypothetical protein
MILEKPKVKNAKNSMIKQYKKSPRKSGTKNPKRRTVKEKPFGQNTVSPVFGFLRNIEK